MKNRLVVPLILLGLVLETVTNAQDGDQPVTDGFGFTYLAPDAALPGVPVYNMTVGTAASDFATLRVKGDQLPVIDPIFGAVNTLCTFRTDVAQLRQQSWWMYRDAKEMGRVWHDGFHHAFHFQSEQDAEDDKYGGAMVQNNSYDGLWVVHNGLPEGGRLFPNAQQVLNREGYMALGSRAGWLSVPSTTSTDIRGPWSRLHFFDQAVGTIPYFGWRSQMRNGTLMTGNSDLAYMGHWYDQGATGSGTPVDDNSKVVFGVAENALPAGLTHHQDHFSFRFFSDLGSTADGAANTLEVM